MEDIKMKKFDEVKEVVENEVVEVVETKKTMRDRVNDVKAFGKKHWKKAAIVAGVGTGVLALVLITKAKNDDLEAALLLGTSELDEYKELEDFEETVEEIEEIDETEEEKDEEL
jgi:hypothetical protein